MRKKAEETETGHCMEAKKQQYCGVGGQALMEGVMMRNGGDIGMAVRLPDGSIRTEKSKYRSICRNEKITKIPFLRGPVNFIDSLVMGMKTLGKSADWLMEAEEAAEKTGEEAAGGKKEEKKGMGGLMAGSMFLAAVLCVGLFILLPMYAGRLLRPWIGNGIGLAVAEGVIRVLIFILYILLISRMKDIRRVFMYHGAEHKCINCIERGLELTVENVRQSSREHKRCGTSFLLYVMVISIIVGIFLPREIFWQRLLSRLLMIPVVVSLSYEFIRLAGRFDNPVMRILSRPGMWLQKLTTREPEDDMIEVGIASVETVFDWKDWQCGTFGRETAK